MIMERPGRPSVDVAHGEGRVKGRKDAALELLSSHNSRGGGSKENSGNGGNGAAAAAATAQKEVLAGQ